MNVLIVNYNTQKLTDACICSVNKTTTDARIFVFDNSDIEPYKNTYDNVTVLDNTKSQIVDFNEILDKYKNKTSYGAESNFGTLKHTVSVDKCFDLIEGGFILLDSDVLVKKDLSDLLDETCVYVGDVFVNGLSKKLRLSPHICFINTKMAKDNKIRYFDEKRIVGLSKNGDEYDTGSSFYFDSKHLKNKKINENDYIVHYGAGSWINLTSVKKSSVDSWLKTHKRLWDSSDVSDNENLDLFICTHKDFKKVVNSPVYKVIDTRKIDKSEYKLEDDFYSEFLQFFYADKHIDLKPYVGFCHYRRYFSFMDDIPDMNDIFKNYDAIVGMPIKYKKKIKEFYSGCHNVEDLYIIGGILADKYPSYCSSWSSFINGNTFIPYNMFIMKRDDFKEYIKFIDDVLNEYLNIVGTNIVKRIGNNVEKYLKNFSPNNTIDYQYRIGGYLGERLTNLFLMTKFKRLKTYKINVTEKKYGKNE